MEIITKIQEKHRRLIIGFYEASNKKRMGEYSDIRYLTYKEAIEVICQTPGLHFGYDTTWDNIINALDRWFEFRILEPAGLEGKVIIITKQAEEYYKIAKRERPTTEA